MRGAARCGAPAFLGAGFRHKGCDWMTFTGGSSTAAGEGAAVPGCCSTGAAGASGAAPRAGCCGSAGAGTAGGCGCAGPAGGGACVSASGAAPALMKAGSNSAAANAPLTRAPLALRPPNYCRSRVEICLNTMNQVCLIKPFQQIEYRLNFSLKLDLYGDRQKSGGFDACGSGCAAGKQVMVRREAARRIGILRVACHGEGLAAAAAKVDLLARARAARFLHPAKPTEAVEGHARRTRSPGAAGL